MAPVSPSWPPARLSPDRPGALTLPDGLRLHYRLWRPGPPRRTLVLIHGAASNLTRFTEFLRHTPLKADWDILRLDLRGHGGSPWRGRLTRARCCADLQAVIGSLCRPPVVLVGHSLGAQVALDCAHRRPGDIHGAVLIDPVFSQALAGTSRWLYRLRPLLRLLAEALRLLYRLGIRRRPRQRDLYAWDRAVRRWLRRGDHRAFVRRYASPWADLHYLPVATYLDDILATLAPPPPLGEVRQPLLVLAARHPTFTDPERTRQAVAALPEAEMRIVDAYHWPLTENPAATRAAIEDWLRRRFPAATGLDSVP